MATEDEEALESAKRYTKLAFPDAYRKDIDAIASQRRARFLKPGSEEDVLMQERMPDAVGWNDPEANEILVRKQMRNVGGISQVDIPKPMSIQTMAHEMGHDLESEESHMFDGFPQAKKNLMSTTNPYSLDVAQSTKAHAVGDPAKAKQQLLRMSAAEGGQRSDKNFFEDSKKTLKESLGSVSKAIPESMWNLITQRVLSQSKDVTGPIDTAIGSQLDETPERGASGSYPSRAFNPDLMEKTSGLGDISDWQKVAPKKKGGNK